MKKTFQIMTFVSMTVFALASCGEKVDGAALSKEVCDCYEKANGLPGDDPNRRAEQDKCSQLQKTNWDKVVGNVEAEKAFNDQFPCGM